MKRKYNIPNQRIVEIESMYLMALSTSEDEITNENAGGFTQNSRDNISDNGNLWDSEW